MGQGPWLISSKGGSRLSQETYWLRWLRGLSRELGPLFEALEEREESKTAAILSAFAQVGLGQHHFAASTGYGYGDCGRDALENALALILQAEAALVRQQIVSGTHAIHLCLEALAEPGREILFAGEPYDTLWTATGLRGRAPGNLRGRGVNLRVLAWPDEPSLLPAILAKAVSSTTSLVYLQRSGGYSNRPALPVETIAAITRALKQLPDPPLIFVDNCYGEFVEDREPTACGIDLMAGSLIKNPGGGLAPAGGYVAGRRELVELVAARLYVPGLNGEIGPNLLSPRPFFQGLFHAPHLVGQAMRGAILCARAFTELGYDTSPRWDQARADLVQRVVFGAPEPLLHFCRAVQKTSPVDARALPEPAPLPGYEDPVIMAGGTFIQGSSSELSVDAPLRPPFAVYWQGGMSFVHARLALANGLHALAELHGGE